MHIDALDLVVLKARFHIYSVLLILTQSHTVGNVPELLFPETFVEALMFSSFLILSITSASLHHQVATSVISKYPPHVLLTLTADCGSEKQNKTNKTPQHYTDLFHF